MLPLIYALSVRSEIEKWGAYAGLAAVLGLAVLSLLYFAQAREVKRLREWAGRAPERAAELEQRVTEQAELARQAAAQRRVVPQQAPAPASQPATAAGAAGARPPGQPVTAASAAGATAAPGAPATPGAPPPAGTAVADPTPAPAPAAPGGPPPSEAGPSPAPAATPPASPDGDQAGTRPPAPTPAPAGANGTGEAPAAVPPPRPAPAPLPPPRTPAAAPAPAALRASTPSATIPPRPGAPARPPGRHIPDWLSRSTALIAVGVLAVVVGGVLLITRLADNGGTPKPNVAGPATTSTTQTPAGTPQKGSGPLRRGDVTVAVLNGTTVTGLAKQASDRLVAAGFKEGTTDNAADQSRSATIVSYAPNYKRAAQTVANILKLGSGALEPLDAGTKAIAGANAEVVVTVGGDRVQPPPSPSP